MRNGLLLPEYPGVYRVGHRAPSTEATYLAAVLACGPGAGLSGRAAGWLERLVKGLPPPPEVTSPDSATSLAYPLVAAVRWASGHHHLPRHPGYHRPAHAP